MSNCKLKDGLPESYRIDPGNEALIPFNEARDCFPGRKRASLSSMHRWRLHGCRGVKLPTFLVGNQRFVSRQAIAWWIERLNANDQPVAAAISPSQRAKQSQAARQALAAQGI